MKTIDPLVGVITDKRLEGAATYGFERISKHCVYKHLIRVLDNLCLFFLNGNFVWF